MKPVTQESVLLEDFQSGKIGRRELLRRGAMLGLSATALGAIARGGVRSASAQDAAAGFGNEPKGPQVDKLTFWTRASADDPSAEGAPNLYSQLQAVADAYKAAIGTTVELVTVPNDDFRSRMSLAAPGGRRAGRVWSRCP